MAHVIEDALTVARRHLAKATTDGTREYWRRVVERLEAKA